MMQSRRTSKLLLLILLWYNNASSSTDAQRISGLLLFKTPATLIGPIPSIVNLAVTGSQLSIVANATTSATASISRVVFMFDGIIVRTERNAPYAIAGDSPGKFLPYSNISTHSRHVVVVEAFHANGTKLSSTTANFTTVNQITTTSPTKSPSRRPTMKPSTTPVNNSTIAPPQVQVKGELRKWHKVTLAFVGPFVSESDLVNPFTNYRLDVLLTHTSSGKQYSIPGYFAADGNAAETSASSGNQWHCNFAPDEVGTWTFRAKFVTGINISTSTLPGTSSSFDGLTGSFIIDTTNKSGRDHRGKGRLMYVGRHHLQYAETGEWFLKAGPDSPENFLAYDDFDNTPNFGNYRKSWSPHQQHYIVGTDPSWKGGKGSGIIGAINYLASQGMNSFSFLTMNIDGDDQNVYPYISPTDVLRIDVSKLGQWEIVFEHADKMGFLMHFKTAEAENDFLLSNGNLGNERKLYYRELIARFGHHLALTWNLGEEISNNAVQIRSFSDYFKVTDPYQHIVAIHTLPGRIEFENLYKSLIGYPTIDSISLQLNPNGVFTKTLQWVNDSATSGHPWIVTNDEQNSEIDGVVPDNVDLNHDVIRQRSLWGNIIAGGAGVEYYFGYGHPNNDLTCQDYTSRENMWKQSRYALEFFSNHSIPFWEMSYDRTNRVNNASDYILADTSTGNTTVLVLYRRTLSKPSTIIMKNLSGMYSIRWYNPRAGGTLQIGSVTTIPGGNSSAIALGNPPDPLDKKDWVILLQKVL